MPLLYQRLIPSRAVRPSMACLGAALLGAVLAAGCASQPERRAAAPSAPPSASPWALPTSTMRWNDYACDLIARNQAGQFPASRTLAYMNLAINNAIILARQQG